MARQQYLGSLPPGQFCSRESLLIPYPLGSPQVGSCRKRGLGSDVETASHPSPGSITRMGWQETWRGHAQGPCIPRESWHELCNHRLHLSIIPPGQDCNYHLTPNRPVFISDAPLLSELRLLYINNWVGKRAFLSSKTTQLPGLPPP